MVSKHVIYATRRLTDVSLSSGDTLNWLSVAGSEYIYEGHDISLSVDPQTTSAILGRDADSPSECVIELDSMVSGQRNTYDLENSHTLYNSFTNDDEEALGMLTRSHQPNPPQFGARLLRDAASTGDGETAAQRTVQSQIDHPTSHLVKAEWFRLYVTEDEKRCTEYNLPSPWSTPLARDTIQRLAAEYTVLEQEVYLKIWAGLCSADSVVVLQETMRILREELGVKLPSPEMKLTIRDRLHAIQSTEQRITGLSLVRRFHVLRLWRDQLCVVNDENWINLDLSNACMTGRGVGNPRHLEESNATKLLMEQIHPDVEKTSAEYERAYRKLKKLRKLGRRLDMLSSAFGTGILGLLPCSEFVSAGSIPAISDSTYAAHIR